MLEVNPDCGDKLNFYAQQKEEDSEAQLQNL